MRSWRAQQLRLTLRHAASRKRIIKAGTVLATDQEIDLVARAIVERLQQPDTEGSRPCDHTSKHLARRAYEL
jgi:hypothetical protein